LQQEKFDVVFSLEITTPATLLANLTHAGKKFGFYFNDGATSCFNKGAEEYLETAFLTHIKLKNRKTYQELIFQACELEYNKEEPFFKLKEEEYNKKFKIKLSGKKKVIGINFSTGSRWPTKAWSQDKVIDLVKRLHAKYDIMLLGGPEEVEEIKELLRRIQKEKIRVISNDQKNTAAQFASVLQLCDKLIVTDSLAMHLAIVLKKPTTALFFSTPPWEIEGYGRVKKITSPLLEKNFFSPKYSKELANSISVEEVLKTLE
jgi:ADP-heptose:LPS heptosyltransferase